MDDKYYTYTFSSGPDSTSFLANSILQWLIWPFRVLIELLTGSPFSNLIDINIIDNGL